MDEADVIHAFAGMRKQIAHPLAALTVLTELEGRRHQAVLGVPQRLAIHDLGALSRVFLQQRFVIESIHLRRTARHEKLDDMFCLGREVRTLGRQRIRFYSESKSLSGSRHADHAESSSQAAEHFTTGLRAGHRLAHGRFMFFKLHTYQSVSTNGVSIRQAFSHSA